MVDGILYNQTRFYVVGVSNAGRYCVRKVKGYYAGSVFGSYGEVRLNVYREDGMGWMCVDPETGMGLSRKYHHSRQKAVDDARKRLSEITPERYGEIRARAKRLWIEKGLMVRKGFGGYQWQQQEI